MLDFYNRLGLAQEARENRPQLMDRIIVAYSRARAMAYENNLSHDPVEYVSIKLNKYAVYNNKEPIQGSNGSSIYFAVGTKTGMFKKIHMVDSVLFRCTMTKGAS